MSAPKWAFSGVLSLIIVGIATIRQWCHSWRTANASWWVRRNSVPVFNEAPAPLRRGFPFMREDGLFLGRINSLAGLHVCLLGYPSRPRHILGLHIPITIVEWEDAARYDPDEADDFNDARTEPCQHGSV